MLVLVLVFDQSFDQLSCQLFAIQLLSDELLALSQSDRFRMSRLTSVDGFRLFARVNRLVHWPLKLQAVQDKIYLQIDYALASDHPPGSSYN